MEPQGWVKLHRKIIKWEWYSDINVCRVFLHLLLTANHEDAKWQGIEIARGQKLTSREHLAQETNLSTMQVRLALTKLKTTREITSKTTNRYTVITIVNYDFHQQNNQQHTKQITNKQPTDNQQITTNKNDKKENNVKNSIYTLEWMKKHREEIIVEASKKFPLKDVRAIYEVFMDGVPAKGYKYKNHRLAFFNWIRSDKRNNVNREIIYKRFANVDVGGIPPPKDVSDKIKAFKSKLVNEATNNGKEVGK